MKNNAYVKNPDMVFRKIADELLLVPVRHNMRNLERIYSLNDVGGRIWELIDGVKSDREIIDQIVTEFDVSPDTAEQDFRVFVESLEKIDGIRKI